MCGYGEKIQCSPGTYQPSEGQYECKLCSSPIEGMFTSSICTSTHDTITQVCSTAPPGYKESTPCVSGSYSEIGSDALFVCKPGYAGTGCVICQNSYATEANSTTCITCPEGSYCLDGSIQPTVCEAGSISVAGSSSCTQCLPGTYTLDLKICLSCPAGSYSLRGASTCTQCGEGL